jgi:hypothetical protein
MNQLKLCCLVSYFSGFKSTKTEPCTFFDQSETENGPF